MRRRRRKMTEQSRESPLFSIDSALPLGDIEPDRDHGRQHSLMNRRSTSRAHERVTFIWATAFGACATMALPHRVHRTEGQGVGEFILRSRRARRGGNFLRRDAIMRSRTPEEIGRAIQ